MSLHALKTATAIAYDGSVSVLDPFAPEARECFRQQAAAIAALSSRVDGTFTDAVRLLHAIEGHIIVTGIGKSGLVGQKIAATLASTGSPAFFLHAAEAYHGDLGMVTDHDAVLLISYSGETDEVVRLLPHLSERGVPMLALVGNPRSTLARGVDVSLDISVDKEICPNNLAPTSSTLTTLAMGDALAVALIRLRGFHTEDFARLHPGGNLGRRLCSRVEDVMLSTDLPVVRPDAKLSECMFALARSRLNVALVVNGDRRLCGLVSEVELGHALEKNGHTLDVAVEKIMNARPAAIEGSAMLGEAEAIMRREGVDALVVVDRSRRVRGVLLGPIDG